MIAVNFVRPVTTAESSQVKPEASQEVRSSLPRHREIRAREGESLPFSKPGKSNISVVEWRGSFLPEEPDGKTSRCRRYEYPKEPNGTTPQTILCDEWEYGDDDEPARTSAVSDWNLVCQRDTLIIVMVVVHCFGSCLFSAAAGCLADSVGRMPVLLAGVVVLIISTAIGCLSRSFHTFVVAKFFSSGGVSAVMITTITSVFEVTTHSNRPLQIIFAGMLAVLFSDIWEATVA
ncbi:hypothetical protein HPB51_000838 [Rhipicephalus microplus]|uniref:Uncharacterized protein n=1 Tax=Rhipicephalus microplus TaxID=6941 RepID=A0A9J6DY38_RHIMP|nr:hypothetical protein HPB51_000838 [Rhipicephalus microplus]